MNARFQFWVRSGTLFAISLLFLVVWGFAGWTKFRDGYPPWFDEKFGPTFLAMFPGLKPSFWILAISEMIAALLVAVSMLRLEFMAGRPPSFLLGSLVFSLLIFVALGMGQWLTVDYQSAFQLFMYFCGTLVALRTVSDPPGLARPGRDGTA